MNQHDRFQYMVKILNSAPYKSMSNIKIFQYILITFNNKIYLKK